MSDIMNYKFQDPTQSFMQMLQFGQGIAQQQAVREDTGVTAHINQQTTLAKIAADQAKLEAEQANREAAEQAMEKLKQPGATRSDYLQWAMLLDKDRAKAVQDSVTGLREEEQAAALKESFEILSAFKTKRYDVSAYLLRRQAEAERRANNEVGAKDAEQLAIMAESDKAEDRDFVEALIGYQAAVIPGVDKAFDALNKLYAEQRAAVEFPVLLAQKNAALKKAETEAQKAEIELGYVGLLKIAELNKYSAELGLTNAQREESITRARKLDSEIKKLDLEYSAALLQNGKIEPEKLFNMERRLADEYTRKSGQFQEMRSTYANIKASFDRGMAEVDDKKAAAADVALVTAFMKMLDPGSVVRESEFHNAERTAGVIDRLLNLGKVAESGVRLTNAQRKEFMYLAEEYYKSAGKLEGEIRGDMTKVAEHWGINASNVLGQSRSAPGFGEVQPATSAEGQKPRKIKEPGGN